MGCLWLEEHFLLYNFVSDRVSSLPDWGPYYGCRIDGLGLRREQAGFIAVRVA